MTGMDETDAVNALEQLGLTNYEAKVFIALQKLGSGTARQVHRVADVPRSQVYSAAESLEERGLLDVQQSQPIQYRPVSIEEASKTLRNRFERERDRAVEYLETVRSDRDGLEEQEDIWTIRGRENITDRTVGLVGEAEQRVYFATASSDLVTDGLVDAIEERAEREIRVTVISENATVRERFLDLDGVAVERPPPEVANNERAGRVLFVDDDCLLMSVLGGEELPGISDETAIWSAQTNFATALIQIIETSLATIESDA
ncbi:MAG: sugar-specific transcriptional regulator TrmB [Halobacteriales archaeon]|jgi:sugar-specific transcriptional regulator TrmB